MKQLTRNIYSLSGCSEHIIGPWVRRTMPLTILADDLTGACDTGALFTGRGPVAVAISPANPAVAQEVLVLDTESRSLPPSAAARRVEEALTALPSARRGGQVFKKIDSTLRGSVGAEVEALLQTTGAPSALVCPAFPAEGRTVAERVLNAHGYPVHQTPLGRDPDFRGTTSDVVEILQAQVNRPVSWLSLGEIRERPGALAAVLSHTRKAIVVADAETDEDLERLADAALSAAPAPVLVGSAGLARAAALRMGYAAPSVRLPDGGPWLIVAGSFHPATQAQIAALEAAGVSGARPARDLSLSEEAVASIKASLNSDRPAFLTVAPPPAPPVLVDRRRTGSALAHVVCRVLAETSPTVLVLVGGETAAAVCQALKAELIEIAGAPRPGLALGRLRGGNTDRCVLLTKAGGFGPPDLLLSLLRRSPA